MMIYDDDGDGDYYDVDGDYNIDNDDIKNV